ncbi:CHAP domain-containing protein [Pararhodospirillum oryzae]|uniref:Peptidase C51 domain-containing protein n=1 Tax=Pararhodospirillum oryzae TaxID=478448 RepID=A0A512H7H5_9PROT|nr:CHAP domain-containing protein [Pararhodospirillum oryzae]GEO81407.1 hypothetical protein ROR02_15380 [Pararhodospirillum oryzae]
MLQDFQRNLAAVLMGTLVMSTTVSPAGAATPDRHASGPVAGKNAAPHQKTPVPPAPGVKANAPAPGALTHASTSAPRPATKPGTRSAEAHAGAISAHPAKTAPAAPPKAAALISGHAPRPGAVAGRAPAPTPPVAHVAAGVPIPTSKPTGAIRALASGPLVAMGTVIVPPVKPASKAGAATPVALSARLTTTGAPLPTPHPKPAFVAAMTARPFDAPRPPDGSKPAFPMGLSTRPAYTPAIAVAPAYDPLLSRRSYWSCVPFVQHASAVHLTGDGWRWWDNAAGQYHRGSAPRPGSVLVFKRSRDLDRGHVALVRAILDRRTIRVDHANWGSGGYKGKIDVGVIVRDVSPRNDWSMTRVWYTPINDLGSTAYPTYGFVYPDRVNGSRDG